MATILKANTYPADYCATFHFYHDSYRSAQASRAKFGRMFPGGHIAVKRVVADDSFWDIALTISQLTADQILIYNIVLAAKYPQYNGWDIDTNNPQDLLRDFGYDASGAAHADSHS